MQTLFYKPLIPDHVCFEESFPPNRWLITYEMFVRGIAAQLIIA